MELRTSVTIAMAHRLPGHPGLCRNLHGHNWTVNIILNVDMEEAAQDVGYVIEFGQLRKNLKMLFDQFDHSTILQVRDVLIEPLVVAMQRLNIINNPPSTENIAGLFYQIVSKALPAFYPDQHVSLDYIELVETPNNTVLAFSGGDTRLV